MAEIISVSNVVKEYGSKNNIVHVLKNINFSVNEGEFIAIMGASGSGKTTLLNVISTIDAVTSGNIYYNETDITKIDTMDLAEFRRKNLGFVFQDFNLLDTLTIQENIALPQSINGENPKEISKAVEEIAEKLEINDILHKFPYEVSGGQKQRSACARAIINHPKLILADEPTGALDSQSSQILLETMKSMNQDLNTTILMVTHDAYSASYCRRILFIKDGVIYNELHRGEKTQRKFYSDVLEKLLLLEGEKSNAE